MTFKLNIERVYGGYILTIERPDGVERRVVGIESPFSNDLENLRRMDLAIGTTILSKVGFKLEDKHFVLNIESYGDVEQDGVEPSSEASECNLEDHERYSTPFLNGRKTSTQSVSRSIVTEKHDGNPARNKWHS